MKFPFDPILIAHVVLTIPQPSSCLCSCLSVCHKRNKNSKQQDLRVVCVERWLGVRVRGQEQFSLIRAGESPGVPASTFGPSCSLPEPPDPLPLPYS